MFAVENVISQLPLRCLLGMDSYSSGSIIQNKLFPKLIWPWHFIRAKKWVNTWIQWEVVGVARYAHLQSWQQKELDIGFFHSGIKDLKTSSLALATVIKRSNVPLSSAVPVTSAHRHLQRHLWALWFLMAARCQLSVHFRQEAEGKLEGRRLYVLVSQMTQYLGNALVFLVYVLRSFETL